MILLSVLNFAPMAIKTLLYKREKDAGKNQTKKKTTKQSCLQLRCAAVAQAHKSCQRLLKLTSTVPRQSRCWGREEI